MKKLAILSVILLGCEFRISDREATEELAEVVNIEFGKLRVEDREMPYAFIDRKKEIQLVFVHGSPGSWNAFIDYFKTDSLIEKYDMIAIDRAGFGFSGFGVAEPSLETQALQIHQVLMQFPNKRHILIGHSLGGPVIGRMAMDFPNSYTGLIFVAPSIDPDLEVDEWYRGVLDTYMGSFFTPKEFEVSNDEILPLKEELQLMLPYWDQITIPSIIIQGTEDSLVPKENADFAQKMMVDTLTKIELLEGVDHFIPWTHPEEIVKAIQQITDSL